MTEVKPRAAAAETVAKLAEAKPTKVRYIGPATERRILKQDWEDAGVPDQAALFLARDEALPVAHFSDAAILVLRRDGNFRFE